MNLLKRIIKLLLKQPDKRILYRYMLGRGRYCGLVKPQKMGHILDKYPRVIRVYRNPNELDVWVTLARPILALLEEDKRLKEERAQFAAERLRKVLMMSATRRIRLDRINYLKDELGLPDNFKRTVIKANPHLFKLVITKANLEKGMSPSVKLLEWDEKFAVPAIDAYRADPATTSGLNEEEKMKKAYSFPINLPPGFKIKKSFRQKLRKWQELPYRSPYADTSDLDMKSEEALKRAVAVVHEFLHVTVEKRTKINHLAHLREDYKLPEKLGKTVLQNPGIFYMSTKSNTQTIFLREGYKKGVLLDKDPLFSIKEKFLELIRMGRRSTKAPKRDASVTSDSDTTDSDTNDSDMITDAEEIDETMESAALEGGAVEIKELEDSDSCNSDKEEDEVLEEEYDRDGHLLSDQDGTHHKGMNTVSEDESWSSGIYSEGEDSSDSESSVPFHETNVGKSTTFQNGLDAGNEKVEVSNSETDEFCPQKDEKLFEDPFETEDDNEEWSIQDIHRMKSLSDKKGKNEFKTAHSCHRIRRTSHHKRHRGKWRH
ncbi:hypothetical protein KP509_35G059500 [Ceratopteris richardii]|nr:hypothetical protein KP509_35G059500 [Ceratopteris richardii]